MELALVESILFASIMVNLFLGGWLWFVNDDLKWWKKHADNWRDLYMRDIFK